MGKARYIFNEQTFTYEKVRLTRADYLKRVGLLFVGGAVFAAFALAISLTYYGNIEEVFLQQEREELIAQLDYQAIRFENIETQLDELHEKDNSFFRSILNTDQIQASVWHGGIGGAQLSNSPIPEVREIEYALHTLKHKTKILRESFTELKDLAVEKQDELRHIPAIRPVAGHLISGFGYRSNPFHGGSEFHKGLDFRCPMGTPIYAVGDGKVITAGSPESGYGIQIEIDHGYTFVTKYAHLSQMLVAEGDSVKRGQLIGKVGSTGYSTGPHLHYEVIRNGVKINPIDYFYNN